MIKEYPNTALNVLEGTKKNPCLVVCLSHIAPKLSVDVFRIRARHAAVSIAVVPSLLEQGIDTYTVSALQDISTCKKHFPTMWKEERMIVAKTTESRIIGMAVCRQDMINKEYSLATPNPY